MENTRGKILRGALAAVGLAAVGVTLLDLSGVAPGLAARLTPLFVGLLMLYLAADRWRLNSTRQIARNVDRQVGRLRGDVGRLRGALGVPGDGRGSQPAKPKQQGKKQQTKKRGGKNRAPANQPPPQRSIQWRGLTFRSQSELRVAQELDRVGVFFIASTKARFRTESDRQSREVDFLICDEGRWGILEVDGPFHDAASDAWRDDRLREHGIRVVRRYDSRRAFAYPESVVADFLDTLDALPDDLPVDTPGEIRNVDRNVVPVQPLQPARPTRRRGHPARQRPRRRHYQRRRPGEKGRSEKNG